MASSSGSLRSLAGARTLPSGSGRELRASRDARATAAPCRRRWRYGRETPDVPEELERARFPEACFGGMELEWRSGGPARPWAQGQEQEMRFGDESWLAVSRAGSDGMRYSATRPPTSIS